ncbi:cell division protein FtsQ/DivIB [Hazenella coriacea]|uniref:Cell division septal protein FtsQ n=1 Tax=Hazenella coriacea TaxID=1179467 RepID=A0A4R3L4N4_9BACL|nr:FtsQ-type POTRA domain-containing protein [Hazenella coriacea]TCS94623.1 cell division septal protein FtsQ [Hazenella coriacea]
MDGRVPSFRSRAGKKRPPSPWAFVFIFLFFMGMLLVLFLQSPLSKIQSIEVTGHSLLTEQEILKTAQLAKGKSYFSTSQSQVEAALIALPEVDKVTIKKSFPNEVYIEVKEKKIIAAFQTSSKQQFHPILSDGMVLTKRKVSDPKDVLVFVGWNQKDQMFKQAVKQVAALPSSMTSELMTIQPVQDHPDQVEIQSKHGHQIFVRISDLHLKMGYYPSFSRHPHGTLYLLESIWFSPLKESN